DVKVTYVMQLRVSLLLCFCLSSASSSKLVCHMTNWAQYRPSDGKFTPDNIDPFLCTHVIYALATINSFNQISPVEWNDEQQFVRLNSFKNVNPDLKTLLTVGGTVNGISPFVAVVAKPESRAAFIKSAISYLRTHNFDGLNLAWEYPGHNGSPQDDKERFTLLELSTAFEDDARDNRRTQLLLSANVAALAPTIERAYEVDKISPHFDFINVLTYDYHGSWEPVTGHNSPLHRSSLDSGSHIHHNINSSISHWLDLGAPAEKLLLGFPTFGRTFPPANGPADAGPYTRTAGFCKVGKFNLTYILIYSDLTFAVALLLCYQICDFLPSATVEWIPEQEVPYATYASSWLGYDDKRSFSSKVQWMTANHLGGAHVWTLDMDDFSGTFCSAGAYPLINHLRLSMGKYSSFPPKPTTTPAPTTTKDPLADICRGRPDGLYENPADKTTYFQCHVGNTYLHHCQSGLIFWDSCKCCDWP
uniref:chitinase n=1 Tax=Anabas testudineus TaxID=64144 RepID=A0A7N6ADU8_ANATE